MIALLLFLLTAIVHWDCAAQRVHGSQYIIYGSGQAYPTPEPGFVLVSLADLKTDNFVEFYNTNGFTDIQQDLDGCCIFNTTDGFLTIGNASLYTYLAPYTASGQHQCSANLESPVFFGGAYDVGPYQGQFIGKLTPALVQQLDTVDNMNGLGCDGLVNTFGIYRKRVAPPPPTGPKYVVYGAGQAFPTPPAGYRQVALSDVQTQDFVDYYNKNFLKDLQQDMLGCCVFNTSGGFLIIGTSDNFSYVGPFHTDGQFECQTQLDNPVGMGGVIIVGPYAGQYFPKLSMDLVSKFNTYPTLVSELGCEGNVNSFGLYVQGGGPTPPTPPTPPPSGPKYVIYGVGQDFPTPPSGYELMSVSDVQTQDFVNSYNDNFLQDLQQEMDGCCVFQVQNGYLIIGTLSNFSYVGPFYTNGQFECLTQLDNPVGMGGVIIVGPYAGQYFPKLSMDLVSQFNVNPTLVNQLGCEGTVNSFGLYMQSSSR